jgi:hypothetical protein
VQLSPSREATAAIASRCLAVASRESTNAAEELAHVADEEVGRFEGGVAAAVELRPVHDRVLAFGEPPDGHLGWAAIVVRPMHVVVAPFTPTVAPTRRPSWSYAKSGWG